MPSRTIGALVLALSLSACTGEAGTRADETGPAGTGVTSSRGDDSVRVWFSRGEEPVPVPRPSDGAPIMDAVLALVGGPTPAEQQRGLSSWFSDTTRHVVRRVQEEDGFVVVDFHALPALIPNASSSAGSQQLLTALDSTIFQFPGTDSVEYRLDGSCQAFFEWLQRDCAVRRR